MKTVLVVDDEKNYLVVLEELLLEDGYLVVTAGSGREAMEIVRNTPVDTVLTDIKMPGMSGIDLLDNLRNVGFRSAGDPDDRLCRS